MFVKTRKRTKHDKINTLEKARHENIQRKQKCKAS